MREIKFRAWDKGQKRMISWKDILGNVPAGFEVIGENYDPLNNDSLLIPMQFTGIKDKNGNEVYEGDIISFGSQDSSIRYEILFVQGDFQTGFKKKSGGSLNDIGQEFCTKFEVIGNIYEKLTGGREK